MTPYIISYLIAGLILTISAQLGDVFGKEHRLKAVLGTLFFWPLIALAAPELFFRNSIQDDADPLKKALEGILASSESLTLSQEELCRLKGVIDAGKPSVAYFGAPGNYRDIFNAFWDADIPPTLYYELRIARRNLEDHEPEPDSGIRFSLRAPEWYIGFSNEFFKVSCKN